MTAPQWRFSDGKLVEFTELVRGLREGRLGGFVVCSLPASDDPDGHIGLFVHVPEKTSVREMLALSGALRQCDADLTAEIGRRIAALSQPREEPPEAGVTPMPRPAPEGEAEEHPSSR